MLQNWFPVPCFVHKYYLVYHSLCRHVSWTKTWSWQPPYRPFDSVDHLKSRFLKRFLISRSFLTCVLKVSLVVPKDPDGWVPPPLEQRRIISAVDLRRVEGEIICNQNENYEQYFHNFNSLDFSKTVLPRPGLLNKHKAIQYNWSWGLFHTLSKFVLWIFFRGRFHPWI